MPESGYIAAVKLFRQGDIYYVKIQNLLETSSFFVILYEMDLCFFIRDLRAKRIVSIIFILLYLTSGAQELPGFIAKAHADPDSICQGQFSQLSVSIQGGPGPFTYLWSPAATLSNPNISNPVATPLSTTLYRLTVQDQWLNTSRDSITVYVGTIPPPPSAVSGPVDLCADSICYYSVIAVPGASSYSWTVPQGAVILNGQNSPSIQLQWGNNGGTVSVIIGNECGTSIPSVLSVKVSTVPSAPIEIQGPSHFCQYDTGSYFTDTVPHAQTYNWTVPQGAQILSGAGSNSIRVRWGNAAGEVGVSCDNDCGTGPATFKPVELDSLPSSAGPISGPDTVCLGKGTYVYHIEPLQFALAYGWTLPQGAVIISGQHSNSVTVEFGINAQPGPVTAFGINLCGNGQASIRQVVTKNCTGLEEMDPVTIISVSPNPATDKLVLLLGPHEATLEILISDRLGRSLYRTSINRQFNEGPVELDVSSLPRGMLFLTVTGKGVTACRKFILR